MISEMHSLLEEREAVAPATQGQSLREAEAVWKRKMDLRERESAQNRKTIIQYAREIKRLHTERKQMLENSGLEMPNAETLKSESAEVELIEKIWRAKMEAQAAASEQAIRLFLENARRATQRLVLDHVKAMEEARNSMKARDATILELQQETQDLKSRLDAEGLRSKRRNETTSKVSGQRKESGKRSDKDMCLQDPIVSRCGDKMAAPRLRSNPSHDAMKRMVLLTAQSSPHYGSGRGVDMPQVKGAAHSCQEIVSHGGVPTRKSLGSKSEVRAAIQFAELMGCETLGDRSKCEYHRSPVRSVASIVRRSRSLAAREAWLHGS